MEKYGKARHATDDNIVERMRLTCRITKATVMHLAYVIITLFSTVAVVTRTRFIVRFIYRVSQEERTKLWEGVPYVKL